MARKHGPLIVIPDRQPGAVGYRKHDILINSEHGAENFTTFPLGLAHNIIPA